jgi:N-acetylglucosaminyl-diphospho-decaprenol L-rhamnosyltransferase
VSSGGPQVEACVVTYRSADTLERLVESLRQVPGVALAVHENGGEAAVLELAAELAARSGIPFRGELCGRGNCGFGAACNSLAEGSRAEDLLFLNPDAEVLTWPEGLSARGRLVGADVRQPDGAPARVWGRSRTLRDEVRLRWLRRPPSPPDGRGYVSGAAFLLPRADFARLGGFDERYFMYYEDIDLGRRAGQAGIPVVVEHRWQVRHLGGHSVGRSAEGLTTALLRSWESGRRFHASRSGSPRGYDALTAVDAALRAVVFGLRPGGRARARANRSLAATATRALLTRRGVGPG